MTVLLNVTHETGDLTQYSSTVTDGGDLSVTVAAALASTVYGLNCLIDDTNSIYGQKDFTAISTGRFRVRFYVDPNGLTMAGSDNFLVLRINEAATNSADVIFRYDGSNYDIALRVREDDGTYQVTSYYDITDDEHYIEVDLFKATAESSLDGTGTLYIDGVLKETLSGLDNFNRMSLTNVQMGAVSGVDAGTSGTFYCDELTANDDGSEIGPLATATAFNITGGGGTGDELAYINSAIRGLTWGGWFYFSNAASADEYLIARWNPTVLQSYRLYRLAAGTIRASVDSGAGAVNVTTTSTVGSGAWTWIVGRWDPSTSLDVFVNRTETNNAVGVPATIQSTPSLEFTVGASHGGANYFSGRASAVFLCGAALPDSIINALFDRSKAAFGVNS